MGLYGSNEPTLDFQILANKSYPTKLEIILYLSFFVAYAVKLPIIPFHTWLPNIHGEAHYNTCMLLAKILLKMGGYGIIRINMELLSHTHSIFAPWLLVIGAIQIVYATFTSFSQCNLKRKIVYSLISHMGFVLIEIGSIIDIGLNGAILHMISHGLLYVLETGQVKKFLVQLHEYLMTNKPQFTEIVCSTKNFTKNSVNLL